jgi:hypothetical protein
MFFDRRRAVLHARRSCFTGPTHASAILTTEVLCMSTVAPVIDVDRRSPNRLPTPSCPRCGSDRFVVAVIRTTKFVFFRCQSCRERELLPKVIPGVASSPGLLFI